MKEYGFYTHSKGQIGSYGFDETKDDYMDVYESAVWLRREQGEPVIIMDEDTNCIVEIV